MLLGEDGNWAFLGEIAFRTFVMFVILMLFFRITGKKEVKQLSIFDLIIIIGLGSAAGDPMFYDDVPLLHTLVVFVTVLLLYQLIGYLSQKNHRINDMLEGKTICVVCDNRIWIKELFGEGVSTDELVSELRVRSIRHLGQVERVYLEFSGQFSVFFRRDEDVVPGLAILPEDYAKAKKHIDAPGTYSCVQCGNTKTYDAPAAQPICENCECKAWSASGKEIRIA